MGEQDRAGSVARDAARLLAGIADLGLETAEEALRRARGVLGRSDLPAMAGDLHREVKAHGDVVLDRVAPPAQAHMEALAQRAETARPKRPETTRPKTSETIHPKPPETPHLKTSETPETPEA